MSLLCSDSDDIFSDFISDVGIAYDRFHMRRIGSRVGAAAPGSSRLVGGSYPEDTSPIETVRTFFPETWIWDLVEVG